MNNNPLLGQVLGGLFGNAMGNRRRQRRGRWPSGGGMGRALGGMALGSVLGRGAARRRAAGGAGAGRHAPLREPHGLAGHAAAAGDALGPAQWRPRCGTGPLPAERHGRAGAVLGRHGQQPAGGRRKVQQVVGQDELREMAQRLGVPEQQVAQAFAEIMPEMVDKLSPQGQVHPQADQVLDAGQRQLEQEIQDVQHRDVHPS